jgi:hypothetical protein
MDKNPFRIDGPAIVSFSGGRTSGYMLWRILDAHGGTLPDGVHVVFANTGREMPATLDFVAECSSRWGVRIVWLEYTPDAPGYVEVSHNSASRAGEPFAALIARKSYLPNPVARFCTQELKIKPMMKWAGAQDWAQWTNVVGLRYDEGHRVLKAIANSEKAPYQIAAPLASAKVRKEDVLAWWPTQPFDLRLAGPHEGNCDGCFLKGRGALVKMLRDHPERMAWWAEQEAARAASFRSDRNYAQMTRAAAILEEFKRMTENVEDEPDAECGVACAQD